MCKDGHIEHYRPTRGSKAPTICKQCKKPLFRAAYSDKLDSEGYPTQEIMKGVKP